ncbi:MAG: addiction module toxin, HicA family [Bacteroidia bacterium]|nr:addiction module toxin, HicA family [Bacteroidia bacterium]
MKLPRDLTGRTLTKHLCARWNYHVVHQTGSHIILETEDPAHQRIAIPDHPFLRIGTLNSILRSVARHKSVTRNEFLPK